MSVRRFLIVEDDNAVREMMCELFTAEGYIVLTAMDGNEALRILSTENVQVMLLDLKLPDMDGLTLCRKIRDFNPVACIYAMTAYTSLFELADAREAGFDDFFVKPVDINLLRKVIADSFEKIERWKRKA